MRNWKVTLIFTDGDGKTYAIIKTEHVKQSPGEALTAAIDESRQAFMDSKDIRYMQVSGIGE